MGVDRAAWSRPVESLLEKAAGELHCDVLVVGSGYGGAFAALELANQNRSVWVLERGREFAIGEFPESLGIAPKFVQYRSEDRENPVGYPDGLFDVRNGKDGAALVGCGLGGGSLINANVVIPPEPEIFENQRWPAALMQSRGCKKGGPLQTEMQYVREILDVAEFPAAERFGKSLALQRLSASIPHTQWRPAPIAVTSESKLNHVGVQQAACTACGNCVTGCNVGAKNTLTMNAIPLAVERGAQFFTGAQAAKVLQSTSQNRRWAVRFTRTADQVQPEHRETFEVHADTVILAAGTFGSTEILLRSECTQPDRPGLRFSDHLGERLSGNADFLGFGFGQKSLVQAAAIRGVDTTDPVTNRVGPTILGIVQASGSESPLPKHALIEDGAIPSCLSGLVSTMLAMQAMPKRYTKSNSPAFHQARTDLDPLGESVEAMTHTQVLLGMGVDAGDGKISLQPSKRSASKHRALQFTIGSRVDDEATEAIHIALRQAERRAWWHRRDGFDSGYYLPNPMYRLLPEEASAVVNETDSRKVTVHPLGGCVMADDAGNGVVDQYGAVFSDKQGNRVHVGLHVLDGAIVPMPVGANPLLTISALAVRAARRIDQSLNASYVAKRASRVSASLSRASPKIGANNAGRQVATEDWQRRQTIAFAEQLETCSPLSADIPSGWSSFLGQGDESLGAQRELELSVGQAKLRLHVSAHHDLVAWLANPSTPWHGSVSLDFVPPAEAESQPSTVALSSGSVTLSLLGSDEPSNAFVRVWRWSSALWAFRASRANSGGLLSTIFSTSGGSQDRSAGDRKPSLTQWLRTMLTNLQFFMRTAYLHTNWRTLSYEGQLSQADKAVARFKGQKRLGYESGGKNPWSSLLELDIELERPADWTSQDSKPEVRSWPLRFHVDVMALLRDGVYQLGQAAHTPQTVVNLLAVAGLWGRTLAATHYWSLKGRDYGQELSVPVCGESLSELKLTNDSTVAPIVHEFEVPRYAEVTEVDADGVEDDRIEFSEGVEPNVALRLSQFVPTAESDSRPLLLIHGLAHGGEVFTTNTVDTNLASYFVSLGREVWVLDHRLSNYLGNTPRESSSVDDIAINDIPGALNVIATYYKKHRPSDAVTLDVFAHCVGSAALSMSILAGHVERCSSPQFKIGYVALHAVHPWVIPSLSNRVSGALAAEYRDFLPGMVLDPIPSKTTNGLEELLDRLAASIPWPDARDTSHFNDDGPDEFGTSICNRMTTFYGREWVHENLDERTHRDLHRLVGPAHIDVFRHLFFLILRQRLTDKDGNNVYLTHNNIREYWQYPTLFATGLENKVFDPVSAAHSFLTANEIINSASSDQTSVRLFTPVDVGHMDFLFGKYASLERDPQKPGSGVYPALNRFYASPESFSNSLATNGEASIEAHRQSPGGASQSLSDDRAFAKRLARDRQMERTPLCGPIIDYEIDETASPTEIHFRIWYELRAYTGGEIDEARTRDVNDSIGLVQFISADTEDDEAVSSLPGIFIVQHLALTADQLRTHFKNKSSAIQTLVLIGSTPQQNATLDSAKNVRPISPTSVESREEIKREAGCIICEARLDSPWVERLAANVSASDGAKAPLSIMLGSCRWPGLVVEQEDRDELFQSMRSTALAREVDALWLLGDQIYADATAGIAETTETGERAAQRYREAFTADVRLDEVFRSAGMRGLLSELPVWMVIDDHEFVDNWPGGSDKQLTSLSIPDFELRFAAFYAYQWRRYQEDSPSASELYGNPRLIQGTTHVERGFWRQFSCSGWPCFALDTRSEREVRTSMNWRAAKIISDNQFDALEHWLHGCKELSGPKFLLSGSPIGLVSRRLAQDPSIGINMDDWSGYPASMERLTKAIAKSELDELYIVTGDPHLTSVTELTINVTPQGEEAHVTSAKVHVVTCSGLNASLPFANSTADEFLLAGVVPNLDSSTRIEFKTAVLSTLQAQFGVLSVEPDPDGLEGSARLAVYGRDGPVCEFDISRFESRSESMMPGSAI